MATRTIDEIFEDYRLYLKGLRPSANVDQTDSDWWIKGRVMSGVLSGVYADSEKNALDAFPQHARREALLRHLFAYFNENSFAPATVAVGSVLVAGDALAAYTAGLQATHVATGNVYALTSSGSLSASGEDSATVQSLLAGQDQNLNPGSVLVIGSPPSGIDATLTVDADGLRDGTNEESEDRAAFRVLTRMRSSARGGNEADYIIWAFEADPAVTGASVLRYVNGLGTVGVFITSGTTDIDTALDNNDAISVEPSDALITIGQDYLRTVCPETDCPFVYAAAEVEVDVTVTVSFVTGDKDSDSGIPLDATNPEGATLTQGELLAREIKRAIYSVPTGGLKIGGVRYVMKKIIQDMIDSRLSANGTVIGTLIQIVADRFLNNLGVGVNLVVGANERPVPGVITIVDG